VKEENKFNRLDEKDRELIKHLILAGGNCEGVYCEDCPFFINKNCSDSDIITLKKSISYLYQLDSKIIKINNDQKADTERLNAMQKLTVGYGIGWILRKSTSGRGLRLHETTNENGVYDIRKAIDDYLDNLTKQGHAK